MAGEHDLDQLLASLSPQLGDGEFVFCTFAAGQYGDHAHLEPVASFREEEGMTLILPKTQADAEGCGYDNVFRCITLGVHSSLDAVGLTAAVAAVLAEQGISANVVAAFYHDHVFVPADRVADALAALGAIRR